MTYRKKFGMEESLNKVIGNKLKEKFSRWTILLLIVISALVTVGYIYNVMQVESLLKEVEDLKTKNESLRNSNELFLTKLNELQSADRITTIAGTKLGMVRSTQAPKVIKAKPKTEE